MVGQKKLTEIDKCRWKLTEIDRYIEIDGDAMLLLIEMEMDMNRQI